MMMASTKALMAGLAVLSGGGLQGAVDLGGHAVDPLSLSTGQAVVLFFAATDCSVSNRYVPEIQRLQAKFAQEGVKFWFIYPNPEDTSAVVGAHDAQFNITSSTALDRFQTLVRQSHVVATPEAAVFVLERSGPREVYLGRIDDRYLSFGHERPHAKHHDLELAIRALLAHHPIPPPGGAPVGCAIMPVQR